MKSLFGKHNLFLQSGTVSIYLFIIVPLLLIALALGINCGYIHYLEKCEDLPLMTCLTTSRPAREEQLSELVKDLVTAIGNLHHGEYNVEILIKFPLEGGLVSGWIEGDCVGTVRGVYSGESNGLISGKMFGRCSPFFIPVPAKASFLGTVNHQQQSVPINITGGVVGFSSTESLVMTF